MASKRSRISGSFGAGIDEVVKHFPRGGVTVDPKPAADFRLSLAEQRDIHALLFEQAWEMQDPRAR